MNYYFCFIVLLSILSFICDKTIIAAPASSQVVANNDDSLSRQKRYFDREAAIKEYYDEKDRREKTTTIQNPVSEKVTTKIPDLKMPLVVAPVFGRK
uniref:Uncharacterized protein n=1 Tax=Strongyloides stercoralis TaxID=6248 RepID=A0A0K0E334_STRER